MIRQKKLLFGASFLLLSTSVYAQEINHAVQYDACMSLVRANPNQAFESATHWKGLGGGDAADHCIARALIALGQYKNGAERMEALADATRRDETFKADLLGQAAQAWHLADDPDRARAILTTAISLNPQDIELYVDRGHVRSMQRAYNEALEDFNQALQMDPNHVDALVFRASVYRLTDQMEPARQDIEKAVALAPSHPEALLERGILNRLAGDTDQAREDWMNVIGMGFSEASQVARSNLQRMDAGLTAQTPPTE